MSLLRASPLLRPAGLAPRALWAASSSSVSCAGSFNSAHFYSSLPEPQRKTYEELRTEEEERIQQLLGTLTEKQRSEPGLKQDLKQEADKVASIRAKYQDHELSYQLNTDIEELFTKEFWEDEDNWDPHDYIWKCKVEHLCDNLLSLPKKDHPAFRQSVDISQGYMTLEWVHPSPPPAHTYEELPIIKEEPTMT